MILIVGLGNPGQKFNKTRHNIGFFIIEKFREINNFPEWEKSSGIHCLYSKKEIDGKGIELIKPLLFMNNSGKVVKYVTKKHNLKSENIFVIHDDIDLPLGKIRIVQNRGAAGHKGVESIIKELRTKNFIRFRIGIEPNQTKRINNTKSFVIKGFSNKEKKTVEEVAQKTIEAIETVLKENLAEAMQKYN